MHFFRKGHTIFLISHSILLSISSNVEDHLTAIANPFCACGYTPYLSLFASRTMIVIKHQKLPTEQKEKQKPFQKLNRPSLSLFTAEMTPESCEPMQQ
ncbi:hypothetical protein CDAR_566371 [Caerostris darwini]|uniref:Uncharacterized protein n=1 Tax=Caerostris darwini TaxID=1538125 RepID=A0AAV4UDM5_9ARAC|nr:hypothetical protein CDAR_566371 [Caerostris darwini]